MVRSAQGLSGFGSILCHLALALCLSCAGGFVAPASRACYSSRRSSRGTKPPTALPGTGGVLMANHVTIATGMPDTSSLLTSNLAGSASEVSDLSTVLLATAAPGNTYLATGLFGIAAVAIAAGAGLLVYSTVTGKNGLGAFLGLEKGSNPFYQETMSKVMPKTPEVLNKIRLPDLDFVEVYNQPPPADGGVEEGDFESGDRVQDASVVATAESLRQRLLEAVQAKDYDLASSLERELASFLRKNGMDFEGDGK